MNPDLDELISVMQEIWRFVIRQHKESFNAHKATILQFHALRYLVEYPNITMKELAKHLRMTVSSATQFINRLSDLKFVSRINDKGDRRIVHLRVTEKGKNELESIKKKKAQQMKKVFSRLSSVDIKTLLRIQKTLLASFKDQ